MLARLTIASLCATLAIVACESRPVLSPAIADVRLGQQGDTSNDTIGRSQDEDAGDVEDDEKIPTEKVKIANDEGGEIEFKLELAVNDAQRAQGLMGREEIEEHGGMLFIYPRAADRSFWMANCLVDLDIIFLDPKGRITALHEAKAEPLRRAGESLLQYENRLRRYRSIRPAQFVIELRKGWIERLGLERDDVIELDVKRLEKLAEDDDFGYW